MTIALKTATAAAALALFTTAPALAEDAVQGGAYRIEPVHSRVLFSVSHLGFTTYYGEFTGPRRPDGLAGDCADGRVPREPPLQAASSAAALRPARSREERCTKTSEKLVREKATYLAPNVAHLNAFHTEGQYVQNALMQVAQPKGGCCEKSRTC